MNIKDRIDYLQKQHDDLDKLIKEEYKIYKEDTLIKHLKKRKLSISDELERLKHGISSSSN